MSGAATPPDSATASASPKRPWTILGRLALAVRQQNWFAVVLEILIVVLGVFLALGANSWWAGREDRRLERDVRDDILAEFEANLRILEADLATNDSVRATLGFFDGLSEPDLLALSSEELTVRFRPYANWAGFDPEMGIVQALVESGNLEVVSDQALRLQLSKWAGLLKEKRRFNLQAVDYQHHEVMPVIARVTADTIWTDAERREVQTLFQGMSALHTIVIANQRRLRDVALGIRSTVEGMLSEAKLNP